jgi:hypothetical protein
MLGTFVTPHVLKRRPQSFHPEVTCIDLTYMFRAYRGFVFNRAVIGCCIIYRVKPAQIWQASDTVQTTFTQLKLLASMERVDGRLSW